MPRRILSGILMTRATEGRAVLDLRTNEAEGDAWAVGQRSLGPAGAFASEPITFFALRELCPASGACAKIDEHERSAERVEVSWKGLREIGYLVIGEVAER